MEFKTLLYLLALSILCNTTRSFSIDEMKQLIKITRDKGLPNKNSPPMISFNEKACFHQLEDFFTGIANDDPAALKGYQQKNS